MLPNVCAKYLSFQKPAMFAVNHDVMRAFKEVQSDDFEKISSNGILKNLFVFYNIFHVFSLGESQERRN